MSEQIVELLMTYLRRPFTDMKDDRDIQDRAAEDWACGKILDRITDRPFSDPEWLIESFAYELQSFHSDSRGIQIAIDFTFEFLAQIQHPKE